MSQSIAAFSLLIALLVPAAWPAKARACDYYAAPVESTGGVLGPNVTEADENGSGTSASDPFTVANFWDDGHADPGTTLCLLAGEYRGSGSLLRPPADGSVSGTAANRITVRAETDGTVLIDGEDTVTPVRLGETDYWTIEGIDAANGYLGVVTVGGDGPSDPVVGVELKRIVAWDLAEPTGIQPNTKIFAVSHAEEVLLEDVAGFGTARKIFEIYRSVDATIRRAWGRWEGALDTPNLTFSCGYRSYSTTCENVIATADAPSGGARLIGADHWQLADASWAPWSDVFYTGLQVRGSIAYEGPGASHGFAFGEAKGFELVDLVSWASSSVKTFSLANCGAQEWSDCDETETPLDLFAIHLSSIGGDGSPRFKSQWTVQDHGSSDPSSPPDIFTPTSGAEVCYRTIDHYETTTPLWPWPMDDRIFAATEAAHGSGNGVDVTDEIEGLFGTIPSACRSD